MSVTCVNYGETASVHSKRLFIEEPNRTETFYDCVYANIQPRPHTTGSLVVGYKSNKIVKKDSNINSLTIIAVNTVISLYLSALN